MSQKRIALHTLGCKLNFAESSTIGRQFAQRGYRVVEIDEPAEVCVINTCSVTDRADRECRQIVRRALKHSPDAYIVVTGCYAQLRPNEIAAIPGVDMVLGTNEKLSLFDFVDGLEKRSKPKIRVSRIEEVTSFQSASSIGFEDRTRAFLKIQDGCDYTCSFCTIPRARGESRSTDVVATVAQAHNVVATGYREIVLTGVNVGDYGKKIGTNLLQLLRELVKVEGLERIRVSSIEPNLLTDELLDFWLAEPKLCKHFHIPLQAGSDELLGGMRRRYRRTWYADRVFAIKSACHHAAIGADVIIGFPGETEQLFEESYQFLVDLPLSYMHVFTYSERPNTPAAAFAEQVEPRIRFERSERVRNLAARKRRAFYESFVGGELQVLFESQRERGWMTGVSDEFVRVNVETPFDLTNQIQSVNITQVKGDACIGHLVDTSLFIEPLHTPRIEVQPCV
jgi:threonylcarbamoyladenosine tRNA methylthiotransferase MtaB